MTNKNYLEEFAQSAPNGLAKTLVDVFINGHRDPSQTTQDIITRLKEEMEKELHREDDAAS